MWKAATVATNSPPQHQGSPDIKAGDVMYVVTDLQNSTLGSFHFITPSPISLALSVAIDAARMAAKLRRDIVIKAPTPVSQNGWLETGDLRTLYGFFERCMVAATFSYQAVEAFSNQVVADGIPNTHPVMRNGVEQHWSAAEIERRCSTEEKVGVLLPQVTGVKSPKGSRKWERLVALKDLRDATIHLKSVDQYARGKPSNQTLYFKLVNVDPTDLPKAAIAMIKHFSDLPEGQEWLAGAEEQLRGKS